VAKVERLTPDLSEYPDLLHENLLWSRFPPHAGMRQHRRDVDSAPAVGEEERSS
jgi:hypothetical protein